MVSVTGALLVAAPRVTASTSAADAVQTVSYRGARVTVPAGWPVRELHGRTGCVRFDRHAVYLGDPARSTCPPSLVGRRLAVHVTGAGAQGVVDPDLVVVAERSPVSVVVASGGNPGAAHRIAATVSLPGAGTRVLAPSSTPAARAVAGLGSRTPAASGRASSAAQVTTRSTRSSRPTLSDTTFTGQGFDACTAPSLATMQTWFTASPYKAANMYIGGASRGCGQPNLNAAWVSAVVAQGWTLIPTYVGLQASCTHYPNRIDPASAASQGSAAADDAVVQLGVLGLGVGTPVYLDMEAYSMSDAVCKQGVIAFVDAWTARLHERGFVSGVYGSAASMMTTLVEQVANPAFRQPDMIWIAQWNGDTSTASSYVPAGYWANHQRIHQYRGGHVETWGGVSINIDNDSVDAAVAPTDLAAEGAFVVVSGQSVVYRIAGGAPLHVGSWEALGLSTVTVQTLSQTQFDSLPEVPADGTFLVGGTTGRVYRVQGGVASHVPSWAPYGGPQPTITVDQAALDNAGTGGPWDHLRSGRPTVRTTGPTELGGIAASVRFGWVGGVTSSAVMAYDARWRRARWDGTYGSWTSPAAWSRTSALDVPLGMKSGYTYCISVRSRNRAGLVSDWTPGRCLTRALDDRRLTTSGGWTARTGPKLYGGTAWTTTDKGATLTRSGARIRRVGLVATVCRTCGAVNVLVDGKKVGRINLEAAKTRRQRVLMLPAFSRQRATVTVKVRSSGLKVQVDGIVLSRS